MCLLNLIVFIHLLTTCVQACPKECVCDKKMRLTVQCSGLTSFPTDFPLQMDYLSIANSTIEQLHSDQLRTYKRLAELYVFDTPLKEIRLIDNMDGLRMFLIQSTKIKMLDSADFKGASKLVGLGISNSELNEIKITDGFKHLKFLTLYGNDIKVLNSKMFENLPDLERLGLQGNKIDTIKIKSGLEKLKYLSLDKNLIKAFDTKYFARAKSLEEISLIENDIATVKASVELPKLKVLKLNCNRITKVDSSSIVHNLPELKKLELKNLKGVGQKNQIECDCHMWKLTDTDIKKVSGYCKMKDGTRLKISKIEKGQIPCTAES